MYSNCDNHMEKLSNNKIKSYQLIEKRVMGRNYLIMLFTKQFMAHSAVGHYWYFLYLFLFADGTCHGVVLYIHGRQVFYTNTKYFPEEAQHIG